MKKYNSYQKIADFTGLTHHGVGRIVWSINKGTQTRKSTILLYRMLTNINLETIKYFLDDSNFVDRKLRLNDKAIKKYKDKNITLIDNTIKDKWWLNL